MARVLCLLGAVVPFALAVALASSQPSVRPDPPQKAIPPAEAIFHTPAGFDKPGRPAKAEGADTGTLRVTVTDADTGEPTFCRVNVVGPDGNFYEPADNPLAAWSLHRTGNREGKGPFRYYGWYFYAPGKFTVRVPAGAVRVEVWKGYEYRPATVRTRVPAGSARDLAVTLRRTLPASDWGYHSGDTHIHLNRTSDADDELALDLIAAEDIRFGYVLCMNDPRTYSGEMGRQIWPQTRGFGPASVKRRGRYAIASGQEYRCNTFGHICLLMHNRLVLEGANVDPNNWPVFGEVGRQTRKLGGYSFHAHGGYGKEIYADFAQRLTDGVELLQFAEYRGVSLQGWYRMLNVGFRFPAVGACDYPYCRALGDCRTYARTEGEPTPSSWAQAAAAGRSFFTTGPILLLEVDGRRPGDSIRKRGDGPHRVTAKVRARCEVAPVTNLELIVNGRTVRERTVPEAAGRGHWLELEQEIELTESSWVAARAYSTSPDGRPDAEAHTNPVYVTVNGRAPYNRDDIDWLLERLGERVAFHQKRNFPEKGRVLEFFEQSRKVLEQVRREGGQPAPPG